MSKNRRAVETRGKVVARAGTSGNPDACAAETSDTSRNRRTAVASRTSGTWNIQEVRVIHATETSDASRKILWKLRP